MAGPASLAAGDAASGWVKAQNSQARLTWCGEALKGPIEPKAALLAFVELELEPGWKTYWRTPGESGVPPSFDWSAAKNVAGTTVFFPAPQRLLDQGGEAIGYTDSAVFPVKIERRNVEAPTPLTATFSYGICKNICVPVEVTLQGACHGGGFSEAIARAADAVPRAPGERRSTDPALLGVVGSVVGPSPKLRIDVDFGTGTAGDLFIEAPYGLFVPLPMKPHGVVTGRASFTVDLSKVADAKDLPGKPLRLTMVSSTGASEAVWVAQ